MLLTFSFNENLSSLTAGYAPDVCVKQFFRQAQKQSICAGSDISVQRSKILKLSSRRVCLCMLQCCYLQLVCRWLAGDAVESCQHHVQWSRWSVYKQCSSAGDPVRARPHGVRVLLHRRHRQQRVQTVSTHHRRRRAMESLIPPTRRLLPNSRSASSGLAVHTAGGGPLPSVHTARGVSTRPAWCPQGPRGVVFGIVCFFLCFSVITEKRLQLLSWNYAIILVWCSILCQIGHSPDHWARIRITGPKSGSPGHNPDHRATVWITGSQSG